MESITTNAGWFLILAANIIILATGYFAFSKFGKIRIGGPKAKPEFSTIAWYAMLLSAGMGIGLMFWSVGEPIYHLGSPSPMFGKIAPGSAAVNSDVSTALFEMLKYFPMTQVLSIVGIVLVTIFFVTSSDSGSLVVDHLTSGGKIDSPVPQRVFWAIMEGVLAAILLLGEGLKTLQTASISTGLPFTVILLIIIYSLYIDLKQELYVEEVVKKKVMEVEQEHFIEKAVADAMESDTK